MRTDRIILIVMFIMFVLLTTGLLWVTASSVQEVKCNDMQKSLIVSSNSCKNN